MWPYAEPEANVLKAMVEMQIFLTFLLSFILRVLPQLGSVEPYGAETYGWVLVISLCTLVAAALGLTARQIRHRQLRKAETDGESGTDLNDGLVLELERTS